ncbi:MAG: amidohydrolase family protein [Candidatus Methylomirabilales bacterium]
MVITARRLFDGSGSPLLENAAVIVRGDRIHWVGPAPGITAAPGESRVNLGDVTLLPGLIDMHNHLRINHAEDDLPRQMRDSDVAYVLHGLRNLETNLHAGVTTMKMNGDRALLDVQMREAIKAGLARGPRLFVAGKGIKSSRCTGGVVATAICEDPESIRAAVRDNIKGGADFIKIFASGRILGPREEVLLPAYSHDEVEAAAEEAHKADRMIVAHCHGGPAADACIQAGVDILEHGWLLSREQLARMADRGTWLCITLGVLLHPPGDMAHRLQDPEADAVRRRLDEIQETMATALANGVRYVLGTDAVHGGLAFELQALERLGARPADLLRAATSQPGLALGRANDLGSVRPGAYADLIAVDGNPLTSLTSLDRVTWVMQGGEVQWAVTQDRAAA